MKKISIKEYRLADEILRAYCIWKNRDTDPDLYEEIITVLQKHRRKMAKIKLDKQIKIIQQEIHRLNYMYKETDQEFYKEVMDEVYKPKLEALKRKQKKVEKLSQQKN